MASEAPRFPLWIPTTLCLVLCAGLFYDHRQSAIQADHSADALRQMSNLWRTASQKLEEQRLVNQALERDLAASVKSNPKNENPRSPVAATPTPISGVKASVQSRPDPRISQLESERDELSGQIGDLTKSLCDIQTQMVETQRRLDSSEGDRQALLRQLKQLQTQKSKLEEQFYNLASLRQQMHRLRDEQAVSRRLDWIRRGIYGDNKGSEILRKSLASARPTPADYNLDVEMHRGGEVKATTN